MTWQQPRMSRTIDDPVTGFQVLGERSSGTNFITQLFLRNFGGLERTPVYGWKHGFIDRRLSPTPGLLTVLVYRHPLRWLQSIHARPLDLSRGMQRLGFSEFIRHEWQGAFKLPDGEEPSTADMDPKKKTNFANALLLRNAKIAYFEEMAHILPSRMVYVRFEDMNRDPVRTLASIAEYFELKMNAFTPVETFKGITESRYVPKQMPRISASDMTFIRSQLDLEQEAAIGYDLARYPRFDGLATTDPRSLRSLARIRPRFGGKSRRARG